MAFTNGRDRKQTERNSFKETALDEHPNEVCNKCISNPNREEGKLSDVVQSTRIQTRATSKSLPQSSLYLVSRNYGQEEFQH